MRFLPSIGIFRPAALWIKARSRKSSKAPTGLMALHWLSETAEIRRMCLCRSPGVTGFFQGTENLEKSD